MIDQYILNQKTIKEFCQDCDGPDGYHECANCGEEIDFQTCKRNEGMCEECLQLLIN